MTSLNENDLEVIRWIQELKTWHVSRAKELYREYARKLADPDVLNRHEIIWGNIQRGEKPGAGLTKETKAMTDKKPKAKKDKKAKKETKAKTESTPRAAVELAELSREVEMTPAGIKHVHTAILFGKKHAALFVSVNHDEPGSGARFAPPHLSDKKLDLVRDYAKSNDLPMAVCVAVRVKGRADQGYAVPEEVFWKFSNKMSRGRVSMGMSGEARLAYREDGWDGCKFTEAKIEEKAA